MDSMRGRNAALICLYINKTIPHLNQNNQNDVAPASIWSPTRSLWCLKNARPQRAHLKPTLNLNHKIGRWNFDAELPANEVRNVLFFMLRCRGRFPRLFGNMHFHSWCRPVVSSSEKLSVLILGARHKKTNKKKNLRANILGGGRSFGCSTPEEMLKKELRFSAGKPEKPA